MLAREKRPAALRMSDTRQNDCSAASIGGASGFRCSAANSGIGIQYADDTPPHALTSSGTYISRTPPKNSRRDTPRFTGVAGANQNRSQRSITHAPTSESTDRRREVDRVDETARVGDVDVARVGLERPLHFVQPHAEQR